MHRFLERLFRRFNARVPFENASKILRDADVSDPAQKPRVPDVFWNDFPRGGDRAAPASRASPRSTRSLTALGSRSRQVARAGARRTSTTPRSSSSTPAAGVDRGRRISAAGAPAGRRGRGRDAPSRALRATATERGVTSRFVSGVPGRPARARDLSGLPFPRRSSSRGGGSTFRADSKFFRRTSRSTAATRQPGHDVRARRSAGRRPPHAHADPACRRPPAPRSPSSSGSTRTSWPALSRSTGDPEPESPTRGSRRTSRSRPRRTPRSRRSRRRTATAGCSRESRRSTGEGRRLPAVAAGRGAQAGVRRGDHAGPGRRALDRPARYAEVGVPVSRSGWRSARAKTWLVREAVLSGAREDLLRNDSARRPPAGTPRGDLLAWARRHPKSRLLSPGVPARQNRKHRSDSRSFSRGSLSAAISRRMRASDGGFMWYR